jgi:hypothetical protein
VCCLKFSNGPKSKKVATFGDLEGYLEGEVCYVAPKMAFFVLIGWLFRMLAVLKMGKIALNHLSYPKKSEIASQIPPKFFIVSDKESKYSQIFSLFEPQKW